MTLGLIKNLTKAAFVALVFCYCTLFTAAWVDIFNILTPFMFQYLLCSLVLVAIFVFFKQKYWVIANVILALLFCTEYISANKLFQPIPSYFEADYDLNIISYNQLYINQHSAEFISSPQVKKADFVAIFEANDATARAANTVKARFPYQYSVLNMQTKSVIALSRWPIIEAKRIDTAENTAEQNVILRFKIQAEGAKRPALIYALHTKSPIPLRRISARNHELETLAALIKKDRQDLRLPQIALGDFNITPYNPHFKQLLTNGALIMPRPDRLPIHSWPSFAPWFIRFQIDHILYSEGVTSQSVQTLQAFGSDHLALQARLSIVN